MDIQNDALEMQIAFEKNCAKSCGVSYDDLKAQLDNRESIFGTRYMETSPRHEKWLVWSEAWQQAQKSAVHEWISLEDVEPNIGETVLICWSDGFDVEPEKDFMDVDIDSGVHYWSNFENDEPTHWMPIPQPPKAQEQVG